MPRKFKDDLRTEQMSARTEKWVTRIGVVGHLAVYTLIGLLFIRAAWQYDPDNAVGPTVRCRSSPTRPSDRFFSVSWRPTSSRTASAISCAPPTGRSDGRKGPPGT